MIGLLGILVVIVISVISVGIKRRKKKEYREEVEEIEKIDERKRIIYSPVFYRDEFQSDMEKHIGTTFLAYEEDSSMWVCPSCETKNSLLKQRCCICHYERKEGV